MSLARPGGQLVAGLEIIHNPASELVLRACSENILQHLLVDVQVVH